MVLQTLNMYTHLYFATDIKSCAYSVTADVTWVMQIVITCNQMSKLVHI